MSVKYQLGLIGYPLSHSFSKKYFSQKFEKEKISGYQYNLFPLQQITDLPELLASHKNLLGLNVTIPYKQAVMPYLNEIDTAALNAGAVNTIKIKEGKLIGYNSDIFGFEVSLLNFLHPLNQPVKQLNALILGTGGAAKAVAYVLEKLEINYHLVSRSKGKDRLTYQDIDENCIKKHQLIINTTPLGMSPKTETTPDLPYHALGNEHFLYDLVYNPEITTFLKRGKEKQANTINGLEMLYLQAEKSWDIWTSDEVSSISKTVKYGKSHKT